MTKYVIVAKVPDTYTADQKKQIKTSIQLAVEETKILVLPNEVEVFSLPLEDWGHFSNWHRDAPNAPVMPYTKLVHKGKNLWLTNNTF